ncbi:MAG: site-2 protease family protein [Chloroflexi bacterium]|nr:site-2 protease family protein [Chloroflexota bacterium]
MNYYDAPIVPLDKVEALRNSISDLFMVGDTTLDNPNVGYVRFRGRFLQDPADCFDELRERFEQFEFTPMIRDEDGRIALIGLPTVFNPPASKWSINLVLFLITIITTLMTGSIYDAESMEQALQLWRGWPFSLSLLVILGAHELGHYFAARYHKLPVTLPYFIPFPPFISIIGTMGAFIKLKAPVKNKRALLDVGASGPLAGLLFAVPIFLYGLATSEIAPLPAVPFPYEGNSIAYILAKLVIFGRMLPSGGEDVYLNQVAWAGWIGLLVTGLNLMPLGQLDGGHISYVLFGQRARQFFWPVIIGLIGLMVLTQTYTLAIWVGLLFFLGRVHAQPLDDVTPLDPKRRAIAIASLIIFLIVFVPTPFQTITP